MLPRLAPENDSKDVNKLEINCFLAKMKYFLKIKAKLNVAENHTLQMENIRKP